MTVDLDRIKLNQAARSHGMHWGSALEMFSEVDLLLWEVESLRSDLKAKEGELEEFRKSLRAKQETVTMGEGRGRHLP